MAKPKNQFRSLVTGCDHFENVETTRKVLRERAKHDMIAALKKHGKAMSAAELGAAADLTAMMVANVANECPKTFEVDKSWRRCAGGGRRYSGIVVIDLHRHLRAG